MNLAVSRCMGSRIMKRTYALAVFFLFSIACRLSAEVHFQPIKLTDAQKMAKKTKKLVMIDFFTDWCHWCHVLDETTYRDDSVSKFADKNFVAVKIEAEHGDGIDLAKKFGVMAYPTIL